MSRSRHHGRELSPDPPTRAQTGRAPRWTGEVPAEIRLPLDLLGEATGSTASWARREFVAWLAIDLAGGELFDDLVLVVYEALANTADHAYRDIETGTVRLIARRARNAIRITVSDHGTWFARDEAGDPTTGASNFRGHGLPLIQLLIRDVHLEGGPNGTVVHLRTPLPAPT